MAELDFFKNEFETFKCSRCRSVYQRINFDSDYKTCPPCSNLAIMETLIPEEDDKSCVKGTD